MLLSAIHRARNVPRFTAKEMALLEACVSYIILIKKSCHWEAHRNLSSTDDCAICGEVNAVASWAAADSTTTACRARHCTVGRLSISAVGWTTKATRTAVLHPKVLVAVTERLAFLQSHRLSFACIGSSVHPRLFWTIAGLDNGQVARFVTAVRRVSFIPKAANVGRIRHWPWRRW